MSEFADFVARVGFPAATAVAAMVVIYRVFGRLADGHLKTLSTIEATQGKLCETLESVEKTQTEMLGLLADVRADFHRSPTVRDSIDETRDEIKTMLDELRGRQ